MPAAGTKRPSAANTPFDLKRRKAKVGKRALTPANVTDTSFKAAALHVSGQDRVAKDDDVGDSILISSKGNKLADLVAQLGHPASAVRLSALKGMGDVVSISPNDGSLPAHLNALRAHLSVIIPSCAKATVDEERDVRQAGLAVLRTLFHSFARSKLAIKPFLSLLLAYTTSALHSLDRPTRVDGTRSVQVLASCLPELLSSASSGGQGVGSKFLPPYITLLAERNMKTSTQNGILQSLVSLMQTLVPTTSKESTEDVQDESDADLVYVAGGSRMSNSLIIDGTKPQHTLPTINSIKDLPMLDNIKADEVLLASSSRVPSSGNTSGSSSNGSLSDVISTSYDVLSKLRDALVEVTERDDFEGASKKANAPMDMDRAILLAEAIRLVWQWVAPHCRKVSMGNGGRTAAHQNISLSNIKGKVDTITAIGHLQKLIQVQIVPLLLTLFPISQDEARSSDRSKLDQLNATMCHTIMELAASATQSTASDEDIMSMSKWAPPLCSFLIPYLNKFTVDEKGAVSASMVVLSVFGKLLMLQCPAVNEFEDDRDENDTEEENSPSDSIRRSMLQKLEMVFFANEESAEMVRSAAGRHAALLVRDVVHRGCFRICDDGVSASLFLSVVSCLVTWGEDFPLESLAILNMLHGVACRTKLEDLKSNKFFDAGRVQEIISGMMVSTKQKGQTAKRSTFERLPERHQRLIVGILVLLQSPSDAIVTSIASICARSCASLGAPVLSASMVDCISEAIYDIRTTISIDTYLKFMITSTGMDLVRKQARKIDAQASGNDKANEEGDKQDAGTEGSGNDFAAAMTTASLAMSMDFSMRRFCRFLVFCGSTKILPMIRPLLSSWLSGSVAPVLGSEAAVQLRAACGIIAMCSLDMQRRGGLQGSIFDLVPTLRSSVTMSIYLMLSHSTLFKDDNDLKSTWIRPIVGLFIAEPSLFDAVFAFSADTIGGGGPSNSSNELNIIQALLDVIQNSRLNEVMSLSKIGEFLGTIESNASEGPPKQLANRMRSLFEVKTGKV